MTNGFASLESGYKINCESFKPEDSPIACRRAHSTVTMWGAWAGVIEGTFISFFSAPAVGALSDFYGRKPFMIAGVALMALPSLVLVANVMGSIPIYWYYPASIISGSVSCYNMCLTSVGDCLPQHYKAPCVGLITACFSIGILIGPIISQSLSLPSALVTSIIIHLLSLLLLVVLVRETAPEVLHRLHHLRHSCNDDPLHQPLEHSSVSGSIRIHAVSGTGALLPMEGESDAHTPLLLNRCDEFVEDSRESRKLGESGKVKSDCNGSTVVNRTNKKSNRNDSDNQNSQEAIIDDNSWLNGWRILWNDPFHRKVTIICVTMTAVIDGAQDLLFQFLQLSLDFKSKDQARLMEMAAVLGLVVKLILLAPMNAMLGDRHLIESLFYQLPNTPI
eukprot:CAMPEP_0175083572 /NCGR_PEP_ID=MMETSP0052_2-20121109/27476_1 /TAXON_ID=51329 ORGANISM="Polytomella parva, Strain SAG 63-3" /NCGR_SAMPLE_ID=MMETSP0052_2 /ASSEMBLY_ACC=CAM_ASM_000194 /LENGTH=390 /DNA_ID=CAMNT_0016355075 /DNA_START=271 /DNA_END=1443 /DNA_ORIENTATION=-